MSAPKDGNTFLPGAMTIAIGGPCPTCDGDGLLTNRDGGGLVALGADDPRESTAEPFGGGARPPGYVVKLGQVCPCPACEPMRAVVREELAARDAATFDAFSAKGRGPRPRPAVLSGLDHPPAPGPMRPVERGES